MAARKLQAVVVLAVLLAAGAGARTFARNAASPAPARVPGAWATDGVTLLWALRSRDLVSCRSAGYSLRRIQRQYGGSVRLVVASVGADTAWVGSMLRGERLRAAVRAVTEEEYRRWFGRAATPRLYVLRGDSVVSAHAPDFAAAGTDTDALERVLGRFARGRATDGG